MRTFRSVSRRPMWRVTVLLFAILVTPGCGERPSPPSQAEGVAHQNLPPPPHRSSPSGVGVADVRDEEGAASRPLDPRDPASRPLDAGARTLQLWDGIVMRTFWIDEHWVYESDDAAAAPLDATLAGALKPTDATLRGGFRLWASDGNPTARAALSADAQSGKGRRLYFAIRTSQAAGSPLLLHRGHLMVKVRQGVERARLETLGRAAGFDVVKSLPHGPGWYLVAAHGGGAAPLELAIRLRGEPDVLEAAVDWVVQGIRPQ